MKLVGIIFGSFFVIFTIILSAYFWGLSIPYKEFESPFTQKRPFKGFVYKNIDIAKEQIKENSDLIIWADIHLTRDKFFIVIDKNDANKNLPLSKNKILNYKLEELRQYLPNLIELPLLLKQFPTQRFILNIIDNVQDIHTDILKVIEPLNIDSRVLIQSDTSVIISSIKELKPMWLYGCSQPDIMRFLSFDSIFILPATPFKGDVYITPVHLLNRFILKQSVFNEIKRRKKLVLIGPIQDKNEYLDAQKFSAIDGYIFDDMNIEK